jgi:hypothetical protein
MMVNSGLFRTKNPCADSIPKSLPPLKKWAIDTLLRYGKRSLDDPQNFATCDGGSLQSHPIESERPFPS